MKKVWLLWILMSIAGQVFAQEDAADIAPEPLDPAYEGIHGMVVFNNASALYASHLPLYRKPHNAQLIYKIEAKDPALIFLVRDADMVTIKPEKFNLQRLLRGEQLTVKADVYIGHFERGGSLTYEQVELTFSEQKYMRMLEELGEPSTLQVYDEVQLSKGLRILVHQIQGAPSYDHLVLLYQNIGCITQIDTGIAVPSEQFLINRLSFCGSMKPLYFETQDFAEGGPEHTKAHSTY
ncbi:hypothetical protein [Aliiglaciecola sp. M165]|uniref:hypothetical protein n=1 Tax=Aliiglaciecola sp. M165 TaxID=2593649 RepID=UPI00117CA5B7|nr:hypothetical protein [Aliiglaciecola sp. M165]TRY31300.1 hypothetical protein FM019_10495 [Aliiglaciecola sp. M165]